MIEVDTKCVKQVSFRRSGDINKLNSARHVQLVRHPTPLLPLGSPTDVCVCVCVCVCVYETRLALCICFI